MRVINRGQVLDFPSSFAGEDNSDEALLAANPGKTIKRYNFGSQMRRTLMGGSFAATSLFAADFANSQYRVGNLEGTNLLALRGPEAVIYPLGGSVSGSWSIVDDTVIRNGSSTGQATVSTGAAVVGKLYELSFTVSGKSGDSLTIRYGGTHVGEVSANGDYVRRVTAVNTLGVNVIPWAGTEGQATVSNISVKEVPATYTRSGAKSELSSTGSPIAYAADVPGIVPGVGYWSRQAFTNLLLNAGQSSNLATQSVTVSAEAHTLSFIGTGTVTLSGVSTAGPLVGTGANDRVTLTFTPTAGSLTLTVTGTVQYAGLVAQSAAGPIIATTTATATVAEDNLPITLESALTDQDMLIWARGTPASISDTQAVLSVYVSANERIRLQLVSGVLTAIVTVGGVDVYSQTVAGAWSANIEGTAILRRSGGNWRVSKYVASTLTGGTETAGTFPTGLNKAIVGNEDGGTVPFRGPVEAAGIIPGTFTTDAEVIAAVSAY